MFPPPTRGSPPSPSSSSCPAGTGGGADQMARLIQGDRRQAQPDEAAADRRQQVRRRRRRRLPRREGRQGRSAQDHHHALQPVHHAARHRRAVQLAGPDAGGDDGARRVRAVGQRRDALQDREGLPRRGRRRPAPSKFKMGGTGSKQEDQIITVGAREGRPAPSSPTSRSRAAARWRRSSSASTSTPRSTTRSRRWRSGAPAQLRPLCVFDDKRMPYKEKVTDRTCPGATSRPARKSGVDVDYLMLRGIFMPAGREARAGRSSTSTCSRRCARRRSGRSSWRRARSTQTFDDRQGVRRLAGEGRADAHAS